jgi:hypothetical protein
LSNAKPPISDWGNLPVYGGLDLSEVNDLTCLVLGARIEDVWHVKPTFWLPEFGLAEGLAPDRVPYDSGCAKAPFLRPQVKASITSSSQNFCATNSKS